MIEKPYPRGDTARRFARQVHIDHDVRLARLAFGSGAPRRAQDPLRDRGPALRCGAVDADAQSVDADVARELEIRVAIAHHEAAGGIDRMTLQIFLDQAELRLAASAGIVQEVRADEHGIEVDTLRGEQLEREPVGAIEGLLRQGRRAQPVLVRDHHQS